MAKKKSKKKNSKPAQPSVRLSQCMIVKNEEKNIEKALGWAKNITCEQIIVDTGSTDRTVEMAEQMGAKVYSFEWINDFSAAKNHAIEQAKGNWIAFLDADEYFTQEDSRKLMTTLRQIQSDREGMGKTSALVSPWVQLDDNNSVFAIHQQCRIFRNRPDIRYQGRIHESPSVGDEILFVPELSIMHTGYSKAETDEKGKALLKAKILREELATAPDDPNLMVYLASAISVPPSTDENLAEADSLNRAALEAKSGLHPHLRQKAYNALLDDYVSKPEMIDDFERYCTRALNDFPGDLDFTYYRGTLLNKQGEYKAALEVLKQCEAMLLGTADLSISYVVQAKPALLFLEMAEATQALDDKEGTVQCMTIALQLDENNLIILSRYLIVMKEYGASDNELISLLGNMYDYDSAGDLALLLRAAGAAGDEALFNVIKSMTGDN